MGLRRRYKTGGYAISIRETAYQAMTQAPSGSESAAFYAGIVRAVEEAQGEVVRPSDPQEWLDQIKSISGWGWIWTGEQLDDAIKNGPPKVPYRLPSVPTPERLAQLGRPRTQDAAYKESLANLDSVMDALRQGGGQDDVERADFHSHLAEAKAGFVQLSERTPHKSQMIDLANACETLSAGLDGDQSQLEEAFRSSQEMISRAATALHGPGVI